MQNEITKPTRLLDEHGHITDPGWARQLFWTYDRADIRAPKWRIKEWDYYLVTNDSYGVAFTISDLGYMGLIGASFLNFEENWEHTKNVLTAFPMGRCHLGAHSDDGDALYRSKTFGLKYRVTPGKRRIRCFIRHFYRGEDLSVNLTLDQPPMDSMCIATPWKEKPTAFYYNQKINCLPASGTVTLGSRTFTFTKGKDYGVLDWGRGVWTYDNTWYWGTGSGQIDGVPFGLNLGYGFSDRSSATENVIFYNNKVHKLSEVDFGIPKKADGSYDFMKKWKITSDDDRLTGTFTPVLNRTATMDFKLIASIQNQVFGHFDGTAVLDDGTALPVNNFFCAVEVIRNKY